MKMIACEPRFRQPASLALALAWAVAVTLVRTPALAAQSAGAADTLLIFEAGSLAEPIAAAAAGFTARTGIVVRSESGGSLAQARKITVEHRAPDVIALADAQLIPELLIPRYASWYARFARNRMGLAYGDRARGASALSDSTWWKVLSSDGVRSVRSDPNLDPGGYRAVIVARLAERHYGRPGLAQRLLDHSVLYSSFPGTPNPDSLLESGTVDYAWIYESYAAEHGLHFFRLPSDIDLSDPANSAIYATASLRIAGATEDDSVTVRGAPIVYGLTIPLDAPHRAAAERFVTYLFSPDGLAALRNAHMELLDPPVFAGNVPDPVRMESQPRHH
jgi:molybdate/tungstate transport system substrate-binding protein